MDGGALSGLLESTLPDTGLVPKHPAPHALPHQFAMAFTINPVVLRIPQLVLPLMIEPVIECPMPPCATSPALQLFSNRLPTIEIVPAAMMAPLAALLMAESPATLTGALPLIQTPLVADSRTVTVSSWIGKPLMSPRCSACATPLPPPWAIST